jgi:hypothetical protein
MQTYKGIFKPKNPKKYKGDVNNIVFRSSYEIRAMRFFDENDDVLEWSSEETVVPYISPIDSRKHRYFPDFLIKIKQKDGTIKTLMVEVKPKAQTQEPKVQSKKTRKYINEVTTWGVNQSKWKYAREYCADRQWDFIILTEEHLGIK